MANPYLEDLQQSTLATGAAPGNPYLDMLQGAEDRQRVQMNGQLMRAVTFDPDHVAAQKRVADALGYPLAAVEAMPDVTREQLRVQQAQEAATQSPVLARAYTDADFARLAHDDGGTLATLANSFRRGWPGLQQNLSATAFGANANILNQIDDIDRRSPPGSPVWGPGSVPDTEDPYGIRFMSAVQRAAFRQQVLSSAGASAANIAEKHAQRAAIPSPEVVSRVMQAKGFGEAVKAFMTDPVTFVAAIGPESLVQSGPGLVAGAVVPGGAAVKAATMGAGSFSTDYGASLVDALGREGVDITDPAALTAAARNAPLMKRAAAQAMAHASVVGAVDAVSGGVASKVALPKALASRLSTRPVAQELGNIVAQVPVQGALGGLGEAGGELAAGQPLDPGNILAEIVGEAFTAPAEVAGVAAGTVRERVQRAQEARASAASLAQLNQVAEQSKLRTRDPKAFEAFVRDAAADGPLQEVYLGAEALMQSGVDIEALAAAVPAVREQLAEAQATGGDIVIPVEQFAAYVAGTDAAAQLLPHLRTAPEAMTPAEAEAFNQDEALRTEVQALAEQRPEMSTAQATPGPSPIEQAREAIVQQLSAANRFTPDVNAAYADMMAAFVGATAERAGLPVQQFMAEFGPAIVSRVDGQETPAATLDSHAPPPAEQAESAPAPAPGELAQAAGRHRGSYAPSTRTIALLERADLSTFIHEVGHYYLDVLTQLAARSDAPDQIKADVQTLMTWFGVADLAAWQAMTLDQQRGAHEQFARGFEAYAFEGEAPSLELAGVFQRFRAWLVRVYRSLVALNVTLTPEVRQAMGRMLASDAQIQAAEAARSYRPLFSSAEQAGMTPEEWQAYHSLGAQATADAVQALQARSLRDMQWLSNAKARKVRALNRDAAAKRKAIEVEVRAEVEALPLYRAERLLRTGNLNGEHVGVKLSRAALIEMYGDGEGARWRKLPDSYLTNNPDNGVHPDVLADGLGLTSGDQLVTQLTTFDDAATVIEGQTDQRLLERYGDLADPQAIERAAEEAIHNDVRAKVLEREVNALGKAVGNRPLLARAAREFAEASIAAKQVRQIRPAQYGAAEARAGREAAAAFKTGDTVKAAAAKRNQLLNNQLARVAGRAVGEAAKAVDYLRGFDSKAAREAIGQDYVDQIDALLERFDLRASVSDKEIARRKSLAAWVDEQRELGFEPSIDDRLLADARMTHVRDMTLEQLRGLRDTVRNIEHLGRLKQRLLTVQDQRAFDAIVSDAATSIHQHATKTLEQQIENDLPHDRAGKLLAQFIVGHRKLASLMRQMDGGKDGGTMWSVFVRPMNAAGDAETRMRAEATAKLSEIFAPLNKAGDLYAKRFIPEINASLTRAGRLAVALNWGAESNRQRILDGDRWTPAQAQAVLATLTREDWKAVEAVWDHLDAYWPQIAAKERRVNGLEPDKVQAAPFSVTLPGGEVLQMRGGYYPLKYDPARTTKAKADSAAELARQAMQGAYTRATTRRGHTKARVEEVNRPVRKDLGVIFEHVTQVTHDLAWHEWLIDANRLLRAKPIDAAIREHYGVEVLDALSAAVQDIAAGDVPAQNAFERAVNHLRSGVSVAAMGWNLLSALQQPLGLTQSMVRIGPKWVGKGIARWLGDATRMQNTVAWIHERSEFMRHRAQTQNREVNEIANRVRDAGGRSALNPLPEPVRESFFYLMGRMQMVADVPTWLGQYTKSIEAGESEARAVALADQAVIDSQSSGQIKDLAQFQRGGPLQKLFTSFYSAFSATFNLSAESIARTDFSKASDVGQLAVDFLLLYTLPALLGMLLKEALRGGGDDGEDMAAKLAREQLNYIASTMLGVRELGAAISGQFGYSGPAGTRFFADMAKLGKQVQQGEADAALLKAANQAAGVLFHYPALQLERLVAGFEAWRTGDADARAPLFGPPPKK